MSCSTLIELRYIVTNTNVNPELFVIPCELLDVIELRCCNYSHLPSDFVIQISIIHDNFHHKLLTRGGRVLANG